MDDREISLWLDKRWYDALERNLDEPLIDKLNTYLDDLINQLPRQEYVRISNEIQEEHLQQKKEIAAAKKFAGFHVIENGSDHYYMVDRGLKTLDAARLLRAYLRQERGADSFRQTLHNANEITPATFELMTLNRLDNSEKITGVFELDFDDEHFSAVYPMEGWKTFSMNDVSAAVFHAQRKQGIPVEERQYRFLEKLNGKELTCSVRAMSVDYLHGSHRLSQDEIVFAGTLSWNKDVVEFYLPMQFDPAKVFSSKATEFSSASEVHIFAAYDLDSPHVRDTLGVSVIQPDGYESYYKYRLTPSEQELFAQKMDAYCRELNGYGLTQWNQHHQPSTRLSQGLKM